MKNLLVISNHPPTNWSPEQKEGWAQIDFVPFPDIAPELSLEQIKAQFANSLIVQIRDWLKQNPDGKVTVFGEFTLCSLIYRAFPEDVFVFPTTKRIVEEKIMPDGTVQKVSVFKFVRWR